MAIQQEVGSLEVGLHADLVLLGVDATDPYRSAIHAMPQDVRLVVLGGVPSYGDPAILGSLPGVPASCFDLDACGAARRVCWSDTPEGPVTPDGIRGVIDGFYADGAEQLFDCSP